MSETLNPERLTERAYAKGHLRAEAEVENGTVPDEETENPFADFYERQRIIEEITPEKIDPDSPEGEELLAYYEEGYFDVLEVFAVESAA